MEGFPSGEISNSLAREIRAILSAVRLREDYSAEELRTHAGRRTSVRAVIFCRWLRFEMEWTGRRWRRSAAWIARGCATGFIASTLQDVIDNRTERQQWDGRAPLALEMRSLILFLFADLLPTFEGGRLRTWNQYGGAEL